MKLGRHRWGPHYEGRWVEQATGAEDSDPEEADATEDTPAEAKGAGGDTGGAKQSGPKFTWELVMVSVCPFPYQTAD